MDCAQSGANATADWIGAGVCSAETLLWTTYGTVVDCAGFDNGGGTAPLAAAFDFLMCVGS